MKGSKADDDVQPPHRQAANYHRRITVAHDGEFIVTMEMVYLSKSDPKPFAYKITAFGFALALAAPMVAGTAAAAAPRAG